ncbi:MAG: preprotein translocase subunit YajC [Chloroflexota bacterium]
MDTLILVALLLVVFWFVLLRPQQRARREQQRTVQDLQIGDEVITVGGLVGRVTRLPDNDGWIGFELAPGVETKLLTVAVSHRIPADEVEDNLSRERRDD